MKSEAWLFLSAATKPHSDLPVRNGFLQGKETPDSSKTNPLSEKANTAQGLVGTAHHDISCFDGSFSLKALRCYMGERLCGNNEVLPNENTAAFQHKVIAYLKTMAGRNVIHRLPVIKIAARALSATRTNLRNKTLFTISYSSLQL